MGFVPGDRVHLRGLGTGVVCQVRGGRRYAIDIKGRIVVAAASDVEPADGRGKSRMKHAGAESQARTRSLDDRHASHVTAAENPSSRESRGRDHRGPAAPSLDLHGKTSAEAVHTLEVFLNDALLSGHSEARVIHGRSGGRVRAAVHHYLRRLAAVETFRVDPRNPGITIVHFA